MSEAHCNKLPQRKALGLVTHDNTGGPFLVECQGCGEVYPSFHCLGGGQIADTGDYEDARCPHCDQIDPEECDNAALAWNIQQLKINELQQRLNAADQRINEMTAPIPDEPVTWGSPKTVRQLVHQLLMLDQDLEPWAMHRIPDFKDGKQVAAVHLSMSYERVEGRFLSDFKGDGRKIIAFWCKPDPRAEHPTLVAEKLVTRLAEEFPDSDTLLTVECVADLIKEYLTGL